MHFLAVIFFVAGVGSPVLAAGPGDSTWVTVGKYCSSQPQPILGLEKLQFSDGMLAHIYLLSQDQKQICNQAQVFSRVVESSGDDATTYVEVSILRAEQQRTVCKQKVSGTTISDKTGSFSAPEQQLSITMDKVNQAITADFYGSTFCPNGTLRFVLKRKE